MSTARHPFPTSKSTPAEGADVTTGNGAATQAAPLVDRVAQGAHETIDHLAEAAAPRVQRIEEVVAEAGDKLRSTASQAREVGDEWRESLRCTVRDNPLTAVATAFALGALIARLTR